MKQTLKLVYLTRPDCNDVMRNAYLINFVYVLCALPVICVTTARVHPVGESLPSDIRVRRVKVVEALLKAGIPLAKADCLRELLEEDSPALTSATNLSQLLPFILHNEIEKLKGEVQGRPVSIIFDGTTHACEAMVILLRFVDDQWIIQQRVCSLKLLAKSLRGEEVAQQIVSIISQELGIQSSLIVADRAAVNNVAMRTVKVVQLLA